MPWLYQVAVRSEEIFKQEEPILFQPIAHTSDQALVQIRNHLRTRTHGQEGAMEFSVKQKRRIGGYDSPMIEAKMKGIA